MPILRTRYREGTGNLLFSRSSQEIQECFPFQIIGKDLLPGISPAGYMIVSVFKLDAQRPSHDRTLKSPQPIVKIKDFPPYSTGRSSAITGSKSGPTRIRGAQIYLDWEDKNGLLGIFADPKRIEV